MKILSFALSLAAICCTAQAFAQAPPPPRPAFDGADANADGQISAAEFAEHQSTRFKTLDVNGDGFLTAEDRAGAGAARGPDGPALLTRFDKDGNGKIDQAEFTAAGQQQFARADQDGNANVTQAELQALRPIQP